MKTYFQFIGERAVELSISKLVSDIEKSISIFKELHWNISGSGFLPVHELFGEIYNSLGEFQDRLAEKARRAGTKINLNPDEYEIQSFDIDDSLEIASNTLTSLLSDVNALASTRIDASLDNILGELSEKLDSFIYKVSSSN